MERSVQPPCAFSSVSPKLLSYGKVAMHTTDRLGLPDPVAGGYDRSATDYLHLREYVRIVSRRRWIIIAMIAAGLFAAILINWLTKPIYQAQATLQIDMDLNVLGVDRPIVPLDQRDWMRESLPTQLGILQSRDLARVAHDELARA